MQQLFELNLNKIRLHFEGRHSANCGVWLYICTMAKIGIIGAGISGLTAAYKLLLDGHAVTVWESSDKYGGAIQSNRSGEWLAEAGPNSIQDSDASVAELVNALGLENRLLEASTEAKRRYIVRDGRPVLVPYSFASAITTPLFSLSAKFSVLKEPFRAGKSGFKPATDKSKLDSVKIASNAENGSRMSSQPTQMSENPDESLADFVRRQLGQEFLDYAINPMVGGIYAGKPEKLSVKHAFPKVWSLENEFGSLIKGAIGRMKERRKSSEPKHQKRVLSFPDGLAELTDALSQKLSDNLKLKALISKITRHSDNKYSLIINGTETDHFDHIIYAGTTWGLSRIQFQNFDGSPPEILTDMTHAPVYSVTLGFNRDQVRHPLDGFGVLVPEVEKMNILGCLFTSSIFPGRAPDNGVTLTTFVGGMRQPELVDLDQESLLNVVKRDLNSLLGLTGEPQFTDITRWSKAIPQYEIGFGNYLKSMHEIESLNKGFHFLGNYKNGISLDASIKSAWKFSI
jgi:protoporphyrinogen/coproporphyrinogen III oxidase